MAKDKKKAKKPAPKEQADATPCCRIEALISMDARGQILLPKDVRKKVGWKPGIKLAVITYESGEGFSRITLAEAEEFMETARQMLGPMVGLLGD